MPGRAGSFGVRRLADPGRPIADETATRRAVKLRVAATRHRSARRDVKNLLSLAPGVVDSGGGQFAMNGVAGGGTGVKMDGTEANADPEFRSVTHFGSQNQISLASLDAIQDPSRTDMPPVCLR